MWLCVLSLALAVEPGPSLSPSELLDLVGDHPAIAAAEAAQAGAIAGVEAMPRLMDPMVEAMVAPLSFTDDPHHGAGPGVSVLVSQPLGPWGGRQAAVEVERAMAQRAGHAVERARADLARELLAMHAAWWSAERAVEAAADHEALVAQSVTSRGDRYATGQGMADDAYRAQLEQLMAAADRAAMEGMRDEMRARLEAMAGRPLPPPTLGEVAAPAAPVAEQAQAEVDEAIARRVAVGREGRPGLRLNASYSSMWDAPAHQWMLGVGTELPIAARARQAALDQADAGVDAARAQAASMARELEAARAAAEARLAAATADRRQREAALPVHEARLQALTEAYAVGEIAPDMLWMASRERTEARLAAARAQAAEHLARVERDAWGGAR